MEIFCHACGKYADYLITQLKREGEKGMMFTITQKCLNCGGLSYEVMELNEVSYRFNRPAKDRIAPIGMEFN